MNARLLVIALVLVTCLATALLVSVPGHEDSPLGNTSRVAAMATSGAMDVGTWFDEGNRTSTSAAQSSTPVAILSLGLGLLVVAGIMRK